MLMCFFKISGTAEFMLFDKLQSDTVFVVGLPGW